MRSFIVTSTCDQPVLYYSWSILYNNSPAKVTLDERLLLVLLYTCFSVRPRYQQNVQSDVNNHTLFNVGTASQIVD